MWRFSFLLLIYKRRDSLRAAKNHLCAEWKETVLQSLTLNSSPHHHHPPADLAGWWWHMLKHFSLPQQSFHLYLPLQFYKLSPAIGSNSKLWHPAWGKKSITDNVCPIKTRAQQVINTWKLFQCPRSALTLHSFLPHTSGHITLLTSALVLPIQLSVYICFHYLCPLLLFRVFFVFFFLTSPASESCFLRPLTNNSSSAVLCVEGYSLNLFSQKAHHRTCLISSYLVCSYQTESIYRPRLPLTLLSALDYSSLPPLFKLKC